MGDHGGLGDQLAQQLEPLGDQLDVEVAEAGQVGARPGEIADEADRVGDVVKTIGIVEVAFLAPRAP